MEVCALPGYHERDLSALLEMWARMDAVRGQDFCSARAEDPGQSVKFLGKLQLAAAAPQKSENSCKKAIEIQAQAARDTLEWRRCSAQSGRWLPSAASNANDACYDANNASYDGAVSPASHDAHDDRQGLWKGSWLPGTHATVASTLNTTAYDVARRRCFYSGADLGSEHSNDAHSSAACSSGNLRWACCRHENGLAGTEEAQQALVRHEKGRGHSFAYSAVYGARHAEEGRAQQHAGDHLCSEGTGRCERGASGGRECKGTVAFSVENLSTAICGKVARIYFAVSSFGSSTSSCHSTCQIASEKVAEKVRPCIQIDHYRRGYPYACDLRRGSRGHGDQRGGRSQRGGSQQDSRGYVLNCYQPEGPLGVGRSAGATGEAPSQKHRGRDGHHDAFWRARRIMTPEYGRLGLEVPAASLEAAVMHWSHSVVWEKIFTSFWQAQQDASDLALELGVQEGLRVDTFSLPPRNKVVRHTVTFCEDIQLFLGGEDNKEFQPVFLRHEALSHWELKPWKLRPIPL